MNEPLGYAAAFIIGLLGSTHCVGMCGGIMGALSLAVPPEKRLPRYLMPILLSYNLGRILSYTAAGALFGGLSWLLVDKYHEAGVLLRLISGFMLVALGLSVANWAHILRIIEKSGLGLWQWLQKPLKTLLPVSSPLQALLVGTLWGWIPCGLIYSTLIWATSTANGYQSAIIMLCFGLGTLPAVMATAILAGRLKALYQSRYSRIFAGLCIIVFGIWTIVVASQYDAIAHDRYLGNRTETRPHLPPQP